MHAVCGEVCVLCISASERVLLACHAFGTPCVGQNNLFQHFITSESETET